MKLLKRGQRGVLRTDDQYNGLVVLLIENYPDDTMVVTHWLYKRLFINSLEFIPLPKKATRKQISTLKKILSW